MGWGSQASRLLSGSHSFPPPFPSSLLLTAQGGAHTYQFKAPVPGSVARFTGRVGAMLIEADGSRMVFKFVATPADAKAAGGNLSALLQASEVQDCYGACGGWSGCGESGCERGGGVNAREFDEWAKGTGRPLPPSL
jgi:hypothetical protein